MTNTSSSLAGLTCALALLLSAACGDSTAGDPSLLTTSGVGAGGAGGSSSTSAAGGSGIGGFGSGAGIGIGGMGTGGVEQFAELWYSVDQLLVRIELSAIDGSFVSFTPSAVFGGLEVGQNAITMLSDGSLLGARLSQADNQTRFYHVAEPPHDGSDVTPTALGTMPDGIMLEGQEG